MAQVHGNNASNWLDAADGVTNGADQVYGYDGKDTMFGLGGDDWLEGGKGGDVLNGGTGIDWASYQSSSVGVYVDLYAGMGLYGDAEGDTLYNFENLFGSAHDDVFVGNPLGNTLKGAGGEDSLLGFSGNDSLWGGADDDQLFGLNDNDRLDGDAGDDWLEGGLGRDEMNGGADADTFRWNAANETSLNVSTADRVMDFDFADGDRIDLSGIDANVYAAGNQAFTFIGSAAFSGTPGEINYYHAGGNTYIQMQTGMSADIEGVIRSTGSSRRMRAGSCCKPGPAAALRTVNERAGGRIASAGFRVVRPSADRHVLPEAEPATDRGQRGARCLVGPGGARMALPVDHHVIELDAVRAFAVAIGLGGLLEATPSAQHRAGEVVIPLGLDDVLALGDHVVVQRSFHHAPPSFANLHVVSGLLKPSALLTAGVIATPLCWSPALRRRTARPNQRTGRRRP